MTIKEIVDKITSEIINPIILLLFSVATMIFIWGIVMYLTAAGSPQAAQKAKSIMLYGIIGLFIMASALGIVKIMCDFFKTSC